MTYNPNKLLIGKIGNVYATTENGKKYNTMEHSAFAIVKESCPSVDEYKDILNNSTYVEFYSHWCLPGKKAISNINSLTTFIQKIHNSVDEIPQIKKITTKIINDKNISHKDINILLYFFNNIDEFKKQIEKKNNLNTYDYITTLTNKDTEPIDGIDDYLVKMIICLASDKTNPILIGQSGIGKSTIVNALAGKIKNNDVPKFLKKKKILDITNLITNTKYAEKLKDEFEKLIIAIIKNNDIIFIDNIESVITLDNCLIDILKNNIQNLKLIGTITNNNYNEYLDNNDINKLFAGINVNEPTDKILFKIIQQTFINYSNKYGIKLFNDLNSITNNLIKLTNKNNRIKNDNLYSTKDDICNPKLVVEIIDKIFAHAKANDKKVLDSKDILFGIDSCDYIKDETKNTIKENIIVLANFNTSFHIKKIKK